MDRVLLSTEEALGLLRAHLNCAVYAPNSVTRAHTTRALDLPEAHDGVVVAGSPVGTSEFAASFAQERTKGVAHLVNELAELPLRHQDRFVPLRKSMVPRLVQLVHTAPLGANGDQVDESVALTAVSIQVAAET
jgi:hypothetical protein